MVVVDEDGATVAVDATSAASVDAVGASAREAELIGELIDERSRVEANA